MFCKKLIINIGKFYHDSIREYMLHSRITFFYVRDKKQKLVMGVKSLIAQTLVTFLTIGAIDSFVRY